MGDDDLADRDVLPRHGLGAEFGDGIRGHHRRREVVAARRPRARVAPGSMAWRATYTGRTSPHDRRAASTPAAASITNSPAVAASTATIAQYNHGERARVSRRRAAIDIGSSRSACGSGEVGDGDASAAAADRRQGAAAAALTSDFESDFFDVDELSEDD